MKDYGHIFLLFLLLLPGLLRSQQASRSQNLSGIVQDPSGAAIVGAEVDLERADGTRFGHAATNGAGGFFFKNVPFGSYVVVVKEHGFQETRASATLGAGVRTPIRLVMPVASVAENVVVVGTDAAAQISTEIGQNQSGNTVDSSALDRHNNESILYTFKGGTDGAFPATELLLDEVGNLYGTARGGGMDPSGTCGFLQGCGVIFKIDRHNDQSVLYSFTGGTDGIGVSSGLVRDQFGNFYGVTVAGGSTNSNCTGGGPPGTCGVVFKVDSKGDETVLHSFTGGSDGYSPYGSLIRDWQGNLFGVTDAGGNTSNTFCGTTVLALAGANGCGVVFKIDRSGNFSVLHAFGGPDGGPYPDGWLATDFAGNIYGITGNGGNLSLCGDLGCGTVFKIDRNGRESVLYDFTGPTAELPFLSTSFGSVIRDNHGNFYGAAYAGGDTTNAACIAAGGCGVVFKLDPRGNYTVLHIFRGTDGANPWASLYMDQHGDIYGTTTAGGDPTCNCGVVFKITL